MIYTFISLIVLYQPEIYTVMTSQEVFYTRLIALIALTGILIMTMYWWNRYKRGK